MVNLDEQILDEFYLYTCLKVFRALPLPVEVPFVWILGTISESVCRK